MQRIDDLGLAAIERLLAGFTDVEVNQLLVVSSRSVVLDFEIVQSHAIHCGPNRVLVRSVRKLDGYEGPTTKIHAPRDAMPEQHGKHARDAEHQREGEKVPFLAKKIYVGIAKELHLLSNPLLDLPFQCYRSLAE